MRATPSESSRRTRGTHSFVRSRRRLSSSVVVFVADDDDDETVADGETTSSIGSPSSALRARSEARTKTQREKQKREKQRERRRSFVGGFSRASVSVCVCSFKGGVQRVVQLSKRDCVFPLSPGQIFLASATDQSICRNKAEL